MAWTGPQERWGRWELPLEAVWMEETTEHLALRL
jgi:hypothetical protein